MKSFKSSSDYQWTKIPWNFIYLSQIISGIIFTPKPKSDSRSLAAAFTASYSSQLQLMKTIFI